MRPMVFLSAAVAALLSVAPVSALDRPALLYSDPAQGEVTRGPTTAVRLRFNQPMRLDRLRVFDSEGVEQAVHRSRDTAPALEQRGGLARLRPGGYRVEWTASSPAGQSIDGTLFFMASDRRG